jgi:hypothetical protein
MGWKDATRRNLVGGKVELVATGKECWIRPKKLSTAAADRINELQRGVFADAENRAKIRKFREIEERLKAEGKSIEDADSMELMECAPQMEAGYRNEIFQIALEHGIGEHNFVDDTGNLVGQGKIFDESTIVGILDWEPLAAEIFQAIQEYNRPLASRSGGSSMTSSDGSTKDPVSKKETSSPTEASPSS